MLTWHRAIVFIYDIREKKFSSVKYVNVHGYVNLFLK